MFVAGNLNYPGLMFVRKAGAYPSGAPKRSSPIGYALGLTHRHYTWLESLAKKTNTLAYYEHS